MIVSGSSGENARAKIFHSENDLAEERKRQLNSGTVDVFEDNRNGVSEQDRFSFPRSSGNFNHAFYFDIDGGSFAVGLC